MADTSRVRSHGHSSASPRCLIPDVQANARFSRRFHVKRVMGSRGYTVAGPGMSHCSAISSADVAQLVEECSVDNWKSPLRCEVGVTESAGAIVALGKFDAMHVGHRALAIKAAELGGYPILLSFSGMADVLGWPHRLPTVAPCDRPRVLQSWAAHCQGRCPRQRMIPFHEIRHLSPEEFVTVLARDLRAVGVVAGSNYRFGYRAMGDAAALQSLGRKHGLQVMIAKLVETSGDAAGVPEQVSSSRIRQLLACGQVDQVQRYLARPYRLVCRSDYSNGGGVNSKQKADAGTLFIPGSAFLNQPPSTGVYFGTAGLWGAPSSDLWAAGTDSSCSQDGDCALQALEVVVTDDGLRMPSSCPKVHFGHGPKQHIIIDFKAFKSDA